MWLPAPLPRCLSLKARSSKRIVAAIHLDTLKLSHREPRGAAEIRASGDLCVSPLKVSLKCSRLPFVFSPPHRSCIYMCACMHTWMNPCTFTLCYLPPCLSAFVKSVWKEDEITPTFDFDTILLSSHCLHIIYLLYLAPYQKVCLFTLNHAFFIGLYLSLRSVRLWDIVCTRVFLAVESMHTKARV